MIGRRRLGSRVRCELGVKELSVGSWSAFGMALMGHLSVVREDSIESCCLLPRREVDVHVAITIRFFTLLPENTAAYSLQSLYTVPSTSAFA
jgi:hypothetical protein